MTAAVSAAGVTLTVKNNTGFTTDNTYLIIGEIGQEKTEIVQINGAGSAGTSITIDREGGAGGLRFDHDIDTPVYVSDYNQIRFYHGSTSTASASTALAAAASAVTPDMNFTRYEDTTNTTGYGFCRFYNATTTTCSVYSNAIPYTGYTGQMLRSMRKKVRRLLNEPDETQITDDDITDELNLAQKEVAHDRLWTFYEKTKSFSTVANQYEYTLATDVFKTYDCKMDTQPLAVIDMKRWNILRWDADETGDPTHITFWRNRARVYPYPSSSASATAINDASNITAAATTITVDSTSGFPSQGRIIIDSEVISYTGTTSTTFTGCTRGDEDTTAATHNDDATVTERDIIYNFQEEPSDMDDETDETQIPEPSVLAYKAASELALQKDDNTLHDRLFSRYERAMTHLRNVDGPKTVGTPLRVKMSNEIVTDFGIWRDPNQYPKDINQ